MDDSQSIRLSSEYHSDPRTHSSHHNFDHLNHDGDLDAYSIHIQYVRLLPSRRPCYLLYRHLEFTNYDLYL